ncbi:glutathione S-transferase [Gallibacterium salpingitidis]|uniref:Glutathione S-transferase n=1 Tax=Gallibacterium salpingitidis TaxID=505341 RepID=A0AB36E5G4_9PAST|nr:glutathione S-transferase [Gallibacterium salpingitidis]OBX07905.1 glutathione S-transferase [Gallibacterium salpingitidis]OBX11502.1 glutathione S-transferase [Gallibacterium salpingitidis]WKT00705.1 glutathione S-transferase [Gallibacterium salpingitidis]
MYSLYVSKPLSSWSLRPWILLKELGIPFEDKEVTFLEDRKQQQQQFLQFSPTAKVPVLHDQEQIIWDSLAIIEYIAEDYPQVWAEDRYARAWSRSACAEMHSGFATLRQTCGFDPLVHTPLKEVSDQVATEIKRINQLWQEGLNRFGGPYLAGKKFTAVDAFFVPIASRIATYGLESYFSDSPLAYQQKLLALDSFKEWIKG